MSYSLGQYVHGFASDIDLTLEGYNMLIDEFIINDFDKSKLNSIMFHMFGDYDRHREYNKLEKKYKQMIRNILFEENVVFSIEDMHEGSGKTTYDYTSRVSRSIVR